MKRTMLSLVMLAGCVVVFLIGTAFVVVPSASAQLGNTGVPVRCTHANALTSTIGGTGTEQTLTCYRPDGSSFSTVPSGNYLLVTDVVIHEEYGAPIGTSWLGSLEVKRGGAVAYNMPFWIEATPSYHTYSQHFTTPYFVLKADDSLNARDMVTTAYSVNMRFYISGILTTNYSYLPLTVR